MSRAGALAATAQLASAELVAAIVPGARGPVVGATQRIIHMTPGPAVDAGVATAETADKALLKSAVVAASIAAGAAAGGRGLASTGAATGAAAASCRDARPAPSLLAAAVGAATGAWTLAVLGPHPSARRLAATGALAGGATATARIIDRGRLRDLDSRRRALTLPDTSLDAGLQIPGLSPLYTPADSFYVTDVAARPPRVDPAGWRLRVSGMVDRPLELTLDELASAGLTEIDATLVCVHNPVGGDRIGSARWVGVPLAALLDRAGVQPDAQQLLARSVDGFTAGVPVDHVRSGAPALLAIGMNGAPLPIDHGFPARLIVPGLWGADANTKWVTELELTTWGAVVDYWDKRGWPRQPSRVRPAARIDVPVNQARVAPGRVTVAGVAWAPPDGVVGVEVQVDGEPWRPVELGPEVAPTMWRQWTFSWEATPGEHVLRVRAIGRAGAQPEGDEPPYPVGVRGRHAHRVAVTGRKRPGTRRLRSLVDDAGRRLTLAARGVAAWRRRGFPPPPRFPAPVTTRRK